MKEYHDPYLHVAAPRLQMKGKGAPKSTVFGMLGVGGGAHGGVADGVKSLGGLAQSKTQNVKVHDMTVPRKMEYCTEHGHIGGHSATRAIMSRGGPYAGFYMSRVGHVLG